MMVRALIVEDEPLARQTIQEFAREVDWLEIVGEAEDGRVAVRLINKLEPDLLFLDVQMPELTGLQVLERIEQVVGVPIEIVSVGPERTQTVVEV